MSAELVGLLQRNYPNLVPAQFEPHFRRVKRLALPAGSVLFRPGDQPPGFVFVLSGRVGVHLTGQGGRELRLYSVGPGTSCIQTTLGLLGGEAYSGEAVAETDIDIALLPAADFRALMDVSPAFRDGVFRAFGARMADVTRTLEQVAFVRVEARLARHILDCADAGGVLESTHAEIATAIGSVREVVSRRLDALRGRGLVSLERGQTQILDRAALLAIANTQ
ncbi:MAG: Crp/Fnr family transcriptional regulator [Rhizobiaceae bacterium]|jgi:CRP/FNR family transcriptional regulator|nr:Crp/Fnr family transcriptional regulator [Rhizobiaceae bacterium]